jgi:ribonuclease HI
VGRAVRMWIDGGSRGNPGPSAVGVLIEDAAGETLATVSRPIGVTTNNVAEYSALLAGLETAQELGATEVEVISDSELLVRQMLGQYRVKNAGLQPLFAEANQKAARFARFAIRHTGREHNAKADGLVNRALDEQERAGL